MREKISDKLWNWASVIDDQTVAQALKASRLPIVADHIALMPDAHLGKGATVGSVIPTENAVIPAAVGVDIGCGMIAVHTDLTASQLPDNLEPLLSTIERVVPAGVGQGHKDGTDVARQWMATHRSNTELPTNLAKKAVQQFGSLGSGNHFFEVCLDEDETVWVVLHSGSRGVGNVLATHHIAKAKKVAAEAMLNLEDRDLAYFSKGTPEFDAYIADMLWAQDYALANRETMMNAALVELFAFAGHGQELSRINCHHNFTQLELHDGRELWITRKGAIKADKGDLGVIPGSMGTQSYIVSGKGNEGSWNSCSHGAGRRESRTQAKKHFTVAQLEEQMQGKTWLRRDASKLLDESPGAYKDIDQVMVDQADLVEVRHVLTQILNYKGT